MRVLRPLTNEEWKFAEQKHPLVMEFLHRKLLPMDDFYDIVVFGYLSAVQQYIRDPPSGVTFKAMAFRAMKDSVLREREYQVRAKRSGFTVPLDGIGSRLTDPRQDMEQKIKGKSLLEQAASTATLKEARIVNLLMGGFALHEAARFLKIPKAVALSCMEEFCCRARAAIG